MLVHHTITSVHITSRIAVANHMEDQWMGCMLARVRHITSGWTTIGTSPLPATDMHSQQHIAQELVQGNVQDQAAIRPVCAQPLHLLHWKE
jgi:hypothetical protein